MSGDDAKPIVVPLIFLLIVSVIFALAVYGWSTGAWESLELPLPR